MIKWGRIDRSTCLWAKFVTLEGIEKNLHIHMCEVDEFYQCPGPHSGAAITLYILNRIKSDPAHIGYIKQKHKKKGSIPPNARNGP